MLEGGRELPLQTAIHVETSPVGTRLAAICNRFAHRDHFLCTRTWCSIRWNDIPRRAGPIGPSCFDDSGLTVLDSRWYLRFVWIVCDTRVYYLILSYTIQYFTLVLSLIFFIAATRYYFWRLHYFFVDLELTNLYPVDTYMRNIHYEYDSNDDCDEMNIHFDIPLSKYGYSPCPPWIKSLLEGNWTITEAWDYIWACWFRHISMKQGSLWLGFDCDVNGV